MSRFTTIIDKDGNPCYYDTLYKETVSHDQMEWYREVFEYYNVPGARDMPERMAGEHCAKIYTPAKIEKLVTELHDGSKGEFPGSILRHYFG